MSMSTHRNRSARIAQTVSGTVLALWVGAGIPATEGSLEEGLVNPGYHEKPEWFKGSFLDIREDVAEARADGRRTLLYFYQDGCPYCEKLLRDNFGQREIAAKTRANYDVIAVNMWGDREVIDLAGQETSEKAFAKGLRVMFTPTLVFLDERGDVVLRVNGYYPPHRFNVALDFATEPRTSGFREYLAAHAGPPATGTLHTGPGYLRAPHRFADRRRVADRPLLILFEQRQCSACDELHLDILQRPETRSLLASFDVAVVDMWSSEPVQTPDGHVIGLDEWATSLGVSYPPSLVFFDTAGKEVFRTEGYLKAFHIQSALDYVASGAYRAQPEFQRFVSTRADALEDRGIAVDLMR